MKMFKNFKNIIIFILFVLFIGCGTETTNNNSLKSDETTEVTFKVDYDYNFAKLQAIYHLTKISTLEEEWSGAEVGDGFYWYNPMTCDKPAYVEFKVMKDGKDQGYITVSLTESDYTVPEYYIEGKTTYELLQDMAGTKEIRGTRFSPFTYTAETKSRGSKNRVFLGTLSYLNDIKETRSVNSKYDKFLKGYVDYRKEIGGIGDNKERLEAYYKRIKEGERAEKQTRGDPPNTREFIDRTITNSDYTSSSSNKLPYYYQFDIGTSNVGCAPVAAGIILGYWRLRHNKTRFFNTPPVLAWYDMTSNEKDVILDLRNQSYMRTMADGGTYMNDLWWGFQKYVGDRGYSNDIAYRLPDWYKVFHEIGENRPAIIVYKEDSGKGHAAVIYKLVLERDINTNFIYGADCTIRTGWKSQINKTIHYSGDNPNGGYSVSNIMTVEIR